MNKKDRLKKIKLPLNSLYKMPKSRKIRRVGIYFFDNLQRIPFHYTPQNPASLQNTIASSATNISATSGSRDCFLYEHLAPKTFPA
jgi:hypothetical protein